MLRNRFDHLLKLIKTMILKKNAVRAPIPLGERKSLMKYNFLYFLKTLARFTIVLARGESQIISKSGKQLYVKCGNIH